MSSDSAKKIVINKLSGTETTSSPVPPVPAVLGGKQKTYPRGILRKTSRRKPVAPKPTNDPTSSRKKTMRILTGAGQKKLRNTLHNRVKRMDDKTIRQKLTEKKLISSHSKASPALLRKMVEEAVGAGLLKV
jgi:uncharacterized protein with WD repeat